MNLSLKRFRNPEVGTISIMREGVYKVVYVGERLELVAPHFFHSGVGVFANLSPSLVDEVLLKQLLQLFLLGRRELLYILNYLRKGLAHFIPLQMSIALRILSLRNRFQSWLRSPK